MQHENQTNPFLQEIAGMKPIDFGPEPESDKIQPEEVGEEIDRSELAAAPNPSTAGIDVWEHSYDVEPDGYTATCDLWRWSADEEVADHEVDNLADHP